MGFLDSCSWSPKQCWVWVPCHRVGLMLDQLLICYAYKLYTTIDLTYLERSTKLFVVGLVLYFFFREHADYLHLLKVRELRGEDSRYALIC